MSYIDSAFTGLCIELLYGERPKSSHRAFHQDQFVVAGMKYILDCTGHEMPAEVKDYYSLIVDAQFRRLRRSPFFSSDGWQMAVRRNHTH